MDESRSVAPSRITIVSGTMLEESKFLFANSQISSTVAPMNGDAAKFCTGADVARVSCLVSRVAMCTPTSGASSRYSVPFASVKNLLRSCSWGGEEGGCFSFPLFFVYCNIETTCKKATTTHCFRYVGRAEDWNRLIQTIIVFYFFRHWF